MFFWFTVEHSWGQKFKITLDNNDEARRRLKRLLLRLNPHAGTILIEAKNDKEENKKIKNKTTELYDKRLQPQTASFIARQQLSLIL